MTFLKKLLSNSRFHTLCVTSIIALITWNIGPQLTLFNNQPLADVGHRALIVLSLYVFWLSTNLLLFRDHRKRVYLNKVQRIRYKFIRNDFKAACKIAKQKKWYITFGLSDSGQTTLLSEISQQHQGSQQRCTSELIDYWHFDDAVFVSINAKAYGDASQAYDNTRVFSALFTKMAKQKIIPYGVLVTAQLQELQTKPDLFDQEANHIRENIALLNQLFPGIAISIIATKSDLILGFTEFFDSLGPEERHNTCGIQFPAPPYQKTLPEMCDQEFTHLLTRFNHRVLWRMQQESSPKVRHLIKEFPVQIELLKPYIGHFLNQVLPSINVTLNGIYFTSAKQAQAPINHLDRPLKEVYDLSLVVYQPKPHSNKRYFIDQLFQQLIHHESDAVVPRSFTWASYTAAVMALTTIITGTFIYRNYEVHHTNLRAVNTLLNNAKHASSQQPYKQVVSQLYALQQTYNTIKSNQKPLTQKERANDMRLMQQAQLSFWMVLQQRLFLALSNSVEQELLRLTQADKPDYIALYKALSTFLMLHENKHFQENAFISWFDDYWTAQNIGLSEHELLRKYTRLMVSRPLPQQQINFGLLLKAQDVLKQKAPEQLALELYTQKLHTQPITLVNNEANTVLPNTFNTLPDMYTLERMPTVERAIDEASTTVAQYLWTTDSDSTNAKTLSAHLREQYYEDYAKHWQSVVDHIRFVPHKTFNDYLVSLNLLNSTRSPLKELVKEIRLNTEPQAGNVQFNHIVSQPFTAFHTLDVDTPTSPINLALHHLTNTMNAIGNANNPIATAYAHARLRITHNSKQDALSETFAASKSLPAPLQQWTTAFADDGWRIILLGARNYLNAIWGQFVLPEYNQSIKNRYPVFKTANSTVPFTDFSHFFAQNGVMETFYKNYLSDFIDEDSGYRWKRIDNRHIDIPGSTLEQFMRAMLIQKMLFTHNQKEPSIVFSLKQTALSPSVKEFSLLIDNQTVEYANKADNQTQISWPGAGTPDNQLRFIGSNGKTTKLDFNDDWGWFRVLDLATIQPTNKPSTIKAIFKFGGQTLAQFEISSDSVINPFVPDVINAFRCPDVL